MRLSGIMPVLVSPMNEDATPDEEGYRRLLDYVFEAPICGLWMLGSASEDFLMSRHHRVAAARIVSEHMGGKSYLIAGCADPVLPEVCRFFDDTAELAIDAYHLLPPDRKMNTSFIIKYCTMVADRAPKPLWLYNNEKRALKFPPESVRELSQHPSIAGIKLGGYDLSLIVPAAMMDADGFQVIGSGGSHLLVFLSLGCTCHTISAASCFPKQYCKVFSLWQEGKLAAAREKAFTISRMLKALPHPENTEFAAEEKIVLELLGICKRHVHPPFRACTDKEKEQARRVLVQYGVLPG